MAHNKHVKDKINKELNMLYPDREAYLNLTKDFVSKLPELQVKEHDGVKVVREDLSLRGGTKTRAAEFFFSQIKEDVVVYVAPRVGLAPTAIMELANLYNKEVVLFMPSSKEISDHQAHVINEGPKEVFFERIAAMPNLNKIAREYAKEKGYKFLPFGLDHPYVIAGFVRICEELCKKYSQPEEMWTVVSTGVLTRGLQIGLPNAEMKGVCVARNMKSGELGRTEIISEPLAFTQNEKILPPFNTVKSYDAKAWKYIPKNTGRNVWFWNVAGELLSPEGFDKSAIDSYRDWDKNLTNKN
tara:strand:+ start:8332 stop:9228 length:897 start_codon:yes stop_codon:yes gene_type:complete